MRSLIIEPAAGISGDMFVAAAASLAECEGEVIALPPRLGLDRVACRFADATRGGMACRRFFVEEPPAAERHPHRPLAEIMRRIADAGLDDAVAVRAGRMFSLLGKVEAAVHAIPIEQVHFHEVGAVDSIIDIVAAAVCIERLRIEAIFSGPVCTGFGTVATAHGLLPVPAPATEKLLQGMPTFFGPLAGEWTTPTGALILRDLAVGFAVPALATAGSVYGGGSADPPERPNLLRLRLAEPFAAAAE